MDKKKVLVVCLNPTFQETIIFDTVIRNEVNRSADYFVSPSGKGVNVVRVLTQLGMEAAAFTHLGTERAREFEKLCAAENLRLISFESTLSPIRTCTTVIDKAQKTNTELVQEPRAVEADADARAFKLFSEHMPLFDAVVFSGTKAPGYAADLYPRMVEAAKKQGKPVIVDLKGAELQKTLAFFPDIAKPNLSELAATYMPGKKVLENEDSDYLFSEVEKIAREIRRTYGTKLVISRGRFNTWVFDGDALCVVPNKGKDVPVVNTIGCGDTLTAGMVYALLCGKELTEAVAFGMDCALKKAQSPYHGIGGKPPAT